jgi:hypothetical protein
MTLVFIIFSVALGIYLFYKFNSPNGPNTVIYQNSQPRPSFFPRYPSSFTTIPGDVLMNPNVPPLKRNQYITSSSDPRRVPINMRTRGIPMSYGQTGILTRVNGKETILPLMGRALHTNRNKWQYYTMGSKNNAIKLPVSNNGKSCTSEYGCDELMNGDTVYVEGYKDAFKATIYENDTPRYIPYL